MTKPSFDDQQQLEKYSSAVTLSDMEIFIFPELLYSLVLANIMSPKLWAWAEDRWFEKVRKKTAYRKVQRLKQFIMDRYEFNLDLETWGLTTQEDELARFSSWIDEQTISESNALFGYEGDKYYFDLDIRRHFGLDKYDSNVIPYWKTETLEAMDAFRHRDEYTTGAGECVSLATLYAAALFVVNKVPLEDIFLMATPLHSQNFVDVRDGILTNNRRIVTKQMWFNGTELTAKAQRALRNEQITMIAHNTGYIHVIYDKATINRDQHDRFRGLLKDYLSTNIDMDILLNFLRERRDLQECFQVEHEHHGRPRYIGLENVYRYEQSSPYLVNSDTQDNLLEDIDEYAYYSEPIEGRISLNNLGDFLSHAGIDFEDESAIETLVREFNCKHDRAPEIMRDLRDFVHLKPRFPKAGEKTFSEAPAIELNADMTRDEVIAYLESQRETNPIADLAFYAYRDLARTEWKPFVKAAVERNPVSVAGAKELDDDAVKAMLDGMPGESVYDGTRMAQPDELWNFGRGDGLEKALCAANILKHREPKEPIQITSDGKTVQLKAGSREWTWQTGKGLDAELKI
jgi:hypothetical protein